MFYSRGLQLILVGLSGMWISRLVASDLIVMQMVFIWIQLSIIHNSFSVRTASLNFNLALVVWIKVIFCDEWLWWFNHYENHIWFINISFNFAWNIFTIRCAIRCAHMFLFLAMIFASFIQLAVKIKNNFFFLKVFFFLKWIAFSCVKNYSKGCKVDYQKFGN